MVRPLRAANEYFKRKASSMSSTIFNLLSAMKANSIKIVLIQFFRCRITDYSTRARKGLVRPLYYSNEIRV